MQVANSAARPVEPTLDPAAASISGGQFHFAADRAANGLTCLPAGPRLATVTLATGTVHNQATAIVTFAVSSARTTLAQRATASPALTSGWWRWLIVGLISLAALALVAWLVPHKRTRREPADLA